MMFLLTNLRYKWLLISGPVSVPGTIPLYAPGVLDIFNSFNSRLALIIYNTDTKEFVLLESYFPLQDKYYVGWMNVCIRVLPRNKFALPKLFGINYTPLTILFKELGLIVLWDKSFVLVGKSYVNTWPVLYVGGWMNICFKKLPRNRFSLPKLYGINCTPLTTLKRDLDIIPIVDKKLKDEDFLLEMFCREGYTGEELERIAEELANFKNVLECINIQRGYIVTRDLYNSDHYPIISELIRKIIPRSNWYAMDNFNKTKAYMWLINVLLLQIYVFCEEVLVMLDKEDKSMECDHYRRLLNLVSVFRIFSVWSHSLLDNSIKQHLVKKNIRIITDRCIGFDTEYQSLDYGKNELLSAQTSTCTYTKIEVPLLRDFSFEGVNTLTSETYTRTGPEFDLKDISLRGYIDNMIKKYRKVKFNNHDKMMLQICSYLTSYKDVERYNSNEKGYIFMLRKNPIKNLFILGSEDEKLELSFSTLINLVNDVDEITKTEIAKDNLGNLISDIDWWNQGTIEKGLVKESGSWNNNTAIMNITKDIILSNKENKLISELGGYNSLKQRNFSYIENGIRTNMKINFVDRTFLYGHYNTADFSMLKDWDEVKVGNVDLLKKGFVSMRKPIVVGGVSVYLRDTFALASAVANSLEAVGKAHGIIKKKLSSFQYENMKDFLKQNLNSFKSYAMNDSFITIIHALFMNDFSFRLGSTDNPLTLGGLANLYLNNKWASDSYRGYQIDANYPLGDVQTSSTPRGITSLGPVGDNLNYFIGSFRGGRNECFSYGIDKDTRWYDYDLTSCYSTIMSMCGNPDYESNDNIELQRLFYTLGSSAGTPDYVNLSYVNNYNWRQLDFKLGYSALRVKFSFPDTVLYPPLPVNLDKNITIYPLKGETTITGLEFLSALNILKDHNDGYVEVLAGVYIPFKFKLVDGEKILTYKPFYEVINELQANRRKHPKKSAMERIYKDLGNMLYGKVVCGISNKKAFDARTQTMQSMKGNNLANPIIGGWITGFVRALLAELLNRTHALGGKICSVTTDGFVTNIPDLENKILETFDNKDSLLNEYRKIRTILSGKPEALEVKTNVRGLIQWSTRGQLSFNHTDPDLNNFGIPIAAMTGFQKYHFTQQENVEQVIKAMNSGNLSLFLQKSLTGSLHNFKTNSKVSMIPSLRAFKTIFDCKREIIVDDNQMLFSRPYKEISEALYSRMLMNKLRTGVYSSAFTRKLIYPSRNASEELLRYFIRMCCEYLNFNVTLEQKFEIIHIVTSSISKRIRETHVMNIINNCVLNEKHPILNKLNPVLFTKKLPGVLFDTIMTSALTPTFKDSKFFDLFRTKFSNFIIPCTSLVSLIPYVYTPSPSRLALVPVPDNTLLTTEILKLTIKHNIDFKTIQSILALIPNVDLPKLQLPPPAIIDFPPEVQQLNSVVEHNNTLAIKNNTVNFTMYTPYTDILDSIIKDNNIAAIKQYKIKNELFKTLIFMLNYNIKIKNNNNNLSIF